MQHVIFSSLCNSLCVVDPLLWINFRMASSSNLHNGENSLDDLFEHFIETLYLTHTAVAFDTDAN